MRKNPNLIDYPGICKRHGLSIWAAKKRAELNNLPGGLINGRLWFIDDEKLRCIMSVPMKKRSTRAQIARRRLSVTSYWKQHRELIFQ